MKPTHNYLIALTISSLTFSHQLFAQNYIPNDAQQLTQKQGIKVLATWYDTGKKGLIGSNEVFAVVYYFRNVSSDQLTIKKVVLSRLLMNETLINAATLRPNEFTTVTTEIEDWGSRDVPIPTFEVVNESVAQRNAQERAQQQQQQQQQIQQQQQQAEAERRWIEENAATLTIKSDVAVEVIANGENFGVLEPNTLGPIIFYKTGVNVQNLIEIVPIASPAHKVEEIIVLQPKASIIKQYKFMDKIGSLEKARIKAIKDEEDRKANEEVEKVRREEAQKTANIKGVSKEWCLTKKNSSAAEGTLNVNENGTLVETIDDILFDQHLNRWEMLDRGVFKIVSLGVEPLFSISLPDDQHMVLISLTGSTPYPYFYFTLGSSCEADRRKAKEDEKMDFNTYVGSWDVVAHKASEADTEWQYLGKKDYMNLKLKEDKNAVVEGQAKRNAIKKDRIYETSTWALREESGSPVLVVDDLFNFIVLNRYTEKDEVFLVLKDKDSNEIYTFVRL